MKTQYLIGLKIETFIYLLVNAVDSGVGYLLQTRGDKLIDNTHQFSIGESFIAVLYQLLFIVAMIEVYHFPRDVIDDLLS